MLVVVLLNFLWLGALKVFYRILSQTNGFDKSTTMDSGSCGFNKNKHTIQQLQSLRNVLIWVLFSLKKV